MELSWSASCYKQCHHLTAFPLQGAPRRASLFLTSLVHICHLSVAPISWIRHYQGLDIYVQAWSNYLELCFLPPTVIIIVIVLI